MLLTDKRVLLIGGKGGVGKTTTSSALAVLAAERGKKVLLVSTDPAHSLADAFDRDIGDNITRLAPNLDGLELDPDREVEQHLAKVTAQLKRFTRPEMFGEIERQMRLTRQSPGAQEAAMLERIANVIELGLNEYDLVIFDTAPTGHTLRLLSLPEAMAAWTQGLLNANKRSEKLGDVLGHLTPKAGRDIDSPLDDPNQHATAGMDDRNKAITETLLARQRLLQRTREVLTDASRTALLFVLTPEKLPILETGRAVQSLQQEKLPLAGLVVNRILPDSADGDFLAARRAQEKVHLAQIEQDFARLSRYKVPLQATDIQGLSALQHMAELLKQAGL
ncbi:ArsA family ATPase [Rheinheimera nanhaiensis]|uniref:arsenite-transporting ATPase n=1 Tax=Rheinheimera nanhaiensis E407-8 TaxID=562729 RepID=I1E1Q6_9GAMM|nr:ArsA family ATPase [Rheinheimera nanhaiensis]GAB60234.1 arsenite-transporting ATPase [Rheinheimera nanhaiensis E407-8]